MAVVTGKINGGQEVEKEASTCEPKEHGPVKPIDKKSVEGGGEGHFAEPLMAGAFESNGTYMDCCIYEVTGHIFARCGSSKDGQERGIARRADTCITFVSLLSYRVCMDSLPVSERIIMALL